MLDGAALAALGAIMLDGAALTALSTLGAVVLDGAALAALSTLGAALTAIGASCSTAQPSRRSARRWEARRGRARRRSLRGALDARRSPHGERCVVLDGAALAAIGATLGSSARSC
ncbi:hypothetical protein [Polyangium mundeleinium]|uniref:Uncharacterized protein n=1 Tax=Polyangium mundeleinium TaxID=2995306 RepID=A0ABT5EU30_9BACT|nr:hypothetical protein [Polyangium mundeleinium]MDC0745335.1 hypothetical protein [Polyangium mundeleinium]